MLFPVLTMALAMVALGAWAARTAAVVNLFAHGAGYGASAGDPQPNIAHFALSPLVFLSGFLCKGIAGRQLCRPLDPAQDCAIPAFSASLLWANR